MSFCATCRCTLCATCVPSHLHHYLIARPTPPHPPHQPPCQSCADATSLDFLHSQGHLEDAHTLAVTSSLARLQVLFLNGSAAGCSRLGTKSDSWGAILLEAAQGLALEGDASSSSSSSSSQQQQQHQQQQQQHVLIRALHRCPMFSLTRVSGTKASLALYHPRAPEAFAFAALHLGALKRAGITITTTTTTTTTSAQANQLGGGTRRDALSPLTLLVQGHQSHVGLKPAAVDTLLTLSPNWDPTSTPLPPGTPSLLLLPPPRLWSPGGVAATGGQEGWRALEAYPPSPRPPPRLLRTVVELREWVKVAMQEYNTVQHQHQKFCAIAVETKPHGGGGIERVALSTPHHTDCTVVFYMDTLGSSLVNVYGGGRGNGSGSGSGSGSGGRVTGEKEEEEENEGEEGDGKRAPHALAILHPLLPLLLHLSVLKIGPSSHQFTHPLASIAGLHAINVLFLSALQEMTGGEGEGEEREGTLRPPTTLIDTSWEAFGRRAENLHAQVHTASSAAGGPTTTTTNAATLFHAACYVSNISVLAPPPPLPVEKGQQVKRAFPGSEGFTHPTLTPLSVPPWYFTCPGCKQQGHFLVDCQRALSAGGGVGR